jgi:hypothetical protein
MKSFILAVCALALVASSAGIRNNFMHVPSSGDFVNLYRVNITGFESIEGNTVALKFKHVPSESDEMCGLLMRKVNFLIRNDLKFDTHMEIKLVHQLEFVNLMLSENGDPVFVDGIGATWSLAVVNTPDVYDFVYNKVGLESDPVEVTMIITFPFKL